MAEPRGTYIKRANFSGRYGSHFFLDIRYDHWENTDENYSTVRVYAYIGSSDGYSASGSSTPVYVEGNHVGSITSIGVNSYTEIGYIERRVNHDGAGNASFTTNASCNTPWNNVGSASVNNNDEPVSLPNIPRYANITQFDVYGVDETTIGFNWNADAACDDIHYSLDGMDWVGGSYPTTYIGGLGANTSHSIRIRIKRADSQLYTYSDTKYTSTYDYPNPTGVSSGVIDGAFTVNVSNPLGKTYSIELICNRDGTTIGSYNGNINGSIIGFNDQNSINARYQTIPDKQSETYYARLTYGSVVRTAGNGSYTIRGDERPSVTTTAIDSGKVLPTGNITTDLTGNNKKIIKFISDVTVSVSATGEKYATISSYATKYGNNQQSGSSYTYSNVESTTFTGIATDSRGLSNSSNATGLTLINYIKPTIENVELYRDAQTSGTLKCRGNGNYFNDSLGNQNNSLTFKLRYKESGSSTWSDWVTKTMTIGSNNTYSFDFTVGTNFDYTKTYNFEFDVRDKCMIVTSTGTAKPGIPVQGLFENFIENFGIVTFSKGTNEILINGDIKVSGSNKYLKNL